MTIAGLVVAAALIAVGLTGLLHARAWPTRAGRSTPVPAVAPPVPPPSAPPAVSTGALDREVAALAPDAVSVAAWNADTGAVVRRGATGGMPTASVIKLDVLETLLLQHQDAGRALDDTETAQATTMIENSDDDAATALWSDVGGAGAIAAADRRLGTTHLVPQPDGVWGLSTTSADDQLVLLRDLATTGPLTADSRQFALGLMRQVEQDQTWGVGSVADPGTTPAIKNGWLNVDDDAGLWAVGSVGVTTVRGHPVFVAVLTRHDPDEGSGIATVDQLVRAAVDSVVEG